MPVRPPALGFTFGGLSLLRHFSSLRSVAQKPLNTRAMSGGEPGSGGPAGSRVREDILPTPDQWLCHCTGSNAEIKRTDHYGSLRPRNRGCSSSIVSRRFPSASSFLRAATAFSISSADNCPFPSESSAFITGSCLNERVRLRRKLSGPKRPNLREMKRPRRPATRTSRRRLLSQKRGSVLATADDFLPVTTRRASCSSSGLNP